MRSPAAALASVLPSSVARTAAAALERAAAAMLVRSLVSITHLDQLCQAKKTIFHTKKRINNDFLQCEARDRNQDMRLECLVPTRLGNGLEKEYQYPKRDSDILVDTKGSSKKETKQCDSVCESKGERGPLRVVL